MNLLCILIYLFQFLCIYALHCHKIIILGKRGKNITYIEKNLAQILNNVSPSSSMAWTKVRLTFLIWSKKPNQHRICIVYVLTSLEHSFTQEHPMESTFVRFMIYSSGLMTATSQSKFSHKYSTCIWRTSHLSCTYNLTTAAEKTKTGISLVSVPC